MIHYLNVFFYDIYPYICATVFFLGSWLRYDYGQYTWRASSSQMLSKRGMNWASNLFHIGILGIFFGHLFGMLTPHWMYAWFLPVAVKQQLAMIAGGICGVLTLIGGSMLLIRRLFNQRVRATSTTPDIIIMSILLIQCILGLSTIPFSAQYPDGSEMMKLVGWAQGIVTFKGGSSEMLSGVAPIFRVHLVLGMTIFLIFPFTRLVHVWSAPFEYFTRRYQVGQRQLAAVRQMAAHQQMMAEMRLRPVRRPEIPHHVIAEILRRQVKVVHRLPVLVVAELQHPVVALAQQTIQTVRRFLLLVSE